MYRIVVLDGHTLNPGDNPWNPVERLGDVTVYGRSTLEQIPERAGHAQIVLTNKAPLEAPTLDKLPDLRFISVLATGYNMVDVEEAGGRGIPVSNVPEYGTDSVAQFTLALLLELCHRVALHDAAVKAGEWTASPDFCFCKTPQMELAGKSMGIVGFGRIGRRVGDLAHALGMRVLAYNPRPKEAPAFEPFAWCGLSELFEEADVVTLHCPLTAENEGFVDASLLSRMKPSAFFINTARGALVRESHLAAALDEGRLAGAAADVAAQEPIPGDHPLLTARNCILTPHMAWLTLEARRRLMRATADNIQAFLEGCPVNVVNAAYLK